MATFFDDFETLRRMTPRLGLMNFRPKNSQFCNYTLEAEDCHFTMGSDFIKSCQYNYWCYHNEKCLDCSYCRQCIECFECVDSVKCVRSAYLQDCEECIDCSYCYDCQSLRDCFACIGLWRKQFYIFNKAYSKDAYEKTVAKLRKKTPEQLRELFREVKRKRPHAYMHQQLNEGVCTGDYISGSNTVHHSFDLDRCTASAYLNNAINCTNCFDISFAGEPPVHSCYEIMSGMGLEQCMFCVSCWYGKNLGYCEYCFECTDCFGCSGLRGKSNYILNQPFTPEEYQKKTAEIKAQMRRDGIYGTWFPSPYSFADTLASDGPACIDHFTHKKILPNRTAEPLLRQHIQLPKTY